MTNSRMGLDLRGCFDVHLGVAQVLHAPPRRCTKGVLQVGGRVTWMESGGANKSEQLFEKV